MVAWRVPDDDGTRTWMIRSDQPQTRLEQEWWRRYASAAIACFAETGAWPISFDRVEFLEGWPFGRFPPEPEAVLDERRSAHRAWGDGFVDAGTDCWEGHVRGEVEWRLADLRRRRPRTDRLPALVDHVDRCLDHGGHIMGDLHWRFALATTSDWSKEHAELTGDPPVQAAAFVQGIDHATSRLIRDIRSLARRKQEDDTDAFDAAFERFLQRHGRRTGRGFGSKAGFRDPTWSMDPQEVLHLVEVYAAADLDHLDEREAAAKAERRRAVRRLRHRFAATDVWPDLERSHRAAVARVKAMENHNALMEQETEGTVREAIHRLGTALVGAGALAEPDDVFHLGFDELRAAGAGAVSPADVRRLVADHAEEWRAQHEHTPPAVLGPPPPPPPASIVASWTGAAAALEAPPGGVAGTPASPGTAIGRARVVDDTAVPPEVEPGDILVARDAGPAWTPVFPLLGGLVLDAGWVTQHAAIVCREYGIPCVLATRSATTTLVDGATITVDGDTGLVSVAPA